MLARRRSRLMRLCKQHDRDFDLAESGVARFSHRAFPYFRMGESLMHRGERSAAGDSVPFGPCRYLQLGGGAWGTLTSSLVTEPEPVTRSLRKAITAPAGQTAGELGKSLRPAAGLAWPIRDLDGL